MELIAWQAALASLESAHTGYLVGKSRLFSSLQVWLGCRLAGRERIGSLDFVQAKVDRVTPRWVLISANEALLAAKQGRYSRSTDFRGGGSAAVAFQGKTRDESVEEEGGLPLCFVSASPARLCVVPPGELQGRGGRWELLRVLIPRC